LLASKRQRRFLCWGLADPHSWLQQFDPRPDKALKRVSPYDDHLAPKPLRSAIADALRATPAR
jgi:endo-1,4-beta-xylanase